MRGRARADCGPLRTVLKRVDALQGQLAAASPERGGAGGAAGGLAEWLARADVPVLGELLEVRAGSNIVNPLQTVFKQL